MDDAVARGSGMVDGGLGYDTLARKLAEKNIKHAVIAAYTSALRGPEEMRRSAFNTALRAYRMRHPGISEGIACRRVAQINLLCGWVSAGVTSCPVIAKDGPQPPQRELLTRAAVEAGIEKPGISRAVARLAFRRGLPVSFHWPG